jgi:serine/threonine protein phosphatase PrpC
MLRRTFGASAWSWCPFATVGSTGPCKFEGYKRSAPGARLAIPRVAFAIQDPNVFFALGTPEFLNAALVVKQEGCRRCAASSLKTDGTTFGMPGALRISAGQYSEKGRKETNQDFHGLLVPREPQLSSKGVAIALADGISSSDVSQEASQAAVTGFLEDYFCTSDAWSVKTSAQRVLFALNSWLHARNRQSEHRYDLNKGYVCTFSALVIKSATAHLFHVGDARIYRLRDGVLEQLTDDHRVWIASDKSYVGRALGVNPHIEVDYRNVDVETGDVFLLTTDGVHEFAKPRSMTEAIREAANDADGDLERAARRIAREAFDRGSPDNLTVQIVRVDAQPDRQSSEIRQRLSELPFAPELNARMLFDGYRIVRELHASHRSHVHLGVDGATGEHVVIKTPSTDLRADPAGLERLFTEEWIARRIANAHVLKSPPQPRKRNHLYAVFEFIDGQTLAQWMIDHPQSDLPTTRKFVTQIATGLQAFHRLEMVHQDLRPANVMIDETGTLRIIDFGSTQVAGLVEGMAGEDQPMLGTEQYAAPEYFLGDAGTSRSDIYSLGVIAYQMVSGRLPYGAQVSRSRTPAAQRRLEYRPLRDDRREIPEWVDGAIRKAVHPDPDKRYAELSEFVHDLHHPNPDFLRTRRPPLLERNPVAFWKGVSLMLAIVVLVLAGVHAFR